MRALRTLPAILVLASVMGCGSSERDKVESKVREFIQAIDGRHYGTICRDVLAPALLADLAQGGISCEQAMQVAFAQVSDPRLTIGTVTVTGNEASVLTLSQAKGQNAALASLRLVKTASGWRVSALGSPLG